MGGRLAAVLVACAGLCVAATATAARAPAVYAVTVSGRIETSAFVPRHLVDGCDRDGGVYVRTLTFASARPTRVVFRGPTLKSPVRVNATVDFGGTRDQRVECPDGQASTLHVDWSAPRRLLGLPLTLGLWGGQIWLDGAPDSIDGVCFGAGEPMNPLPLAGVYGRLSVPKLMAGRPPIARVEREETERAESDSCQLVRHIHWRITLHRLP